uniref:EGF-like domain-containing protein n=1 Tax=Terrapene triunguis TaxID=2587831 RepID=A0A674JSG3_9SAUR
MVFQQTRCSAFCFVLDGKGSISVDVCADFPCEQQCTDNFGRVLCTCFPGYRFDRERHKTHLHPYCLDIDECVESGGAVCDQLCTNTPGSYRCHCQRGYYIASDGTTCLKSSNGESTLMGTRSCSITCEEFISMKQTVSHLSDSWSATAGSAPTNSCLGPRSEIKHLFLWSPGAIGPPGPSGTPGPRGDMGPMGPYPDFAHIKIGRRGPVVSSKSPIRWVMHPGPTPRGPPGSFDFLLLMMADIRNDIIELQEKVFGQRRRMEFEMPSANSRDSEVHEWGSGQEELLRGPRPTRSAT